MSSIEPIPIEVADPRRIIAIDDGEDLKLMGYEQIMTRKFSFFSMLALAYAVLGTWSTFAQDLGSGLSNGGPVGILYGLLAVFLCNICIAMSLGEICSSMPTALGQAYWVSRLWPTENGRRLSYVTAWINIAGWWTLTASQVAFMTSFMLGMKVMFTPDWDGVNKPWVSFVLYLGLALVATLFNIAACRDSRVLPWFNNGILYQNLALFAAFSITLLVCAGTKADHHFQSGKFVFGGFINQSGWPDGFSWFIGLIQAAYGLTAFDSVIHLVEEMPRPAINAPRVLNLAIISGTITGAIFMIVCLFSIQDIDSVVNTDTGLPFMQLALDTIGLDGSAVLLAIYISNGTFQLFSIITTSSRLTMGFARDGGLPFGTFFSHIDSYWNMPVRSTWLSGFIVGLVAILYFVSDTVLTAILSVSTICLTISYAIPIAVLLAVGRDKLVPGPYQLGRFGYTANIVSLIYCALTTIIFFFPSAPNPAVADMNFAIVVFAIVVVIAAIFWFAKGRKIYLLTAAAKAEKARAEREMYLHGVELNKAGVFVDTPKTATDGVWHEKSESY